MSVHMLGEKKPEEPKEMPSDPVPEGYIVFALIDRVRVYSEAISVTGPVVRFYDAYVSQNEGKTWVKARNLMCFYTPVQWFDAPAPDWWKNRAKLPG